MRCLVWGGLAWQGPAARLAWLLSFLLQGAGGARQGPHSPAPWRPALRGAEPRAPDGRHPPPPRPPRGAAPRRAAGLVTDLRAAEFDGWSYNLRCEPEAPDKLHLCVALPKGAEPRGAAEAAVKALGSGVCAQAPAVPQGFSVALVVDLSKVRTGTLGLLAACMHASHRQRVKRRSRR